MNVTNPKLLLAGACFQEPGNTSISGTWRLKGWTRAVPQRPPADPLLARLLAEIEPAPTKSVTVHCLPRDATHVHGRGVAGCHKHIAKVEFLHMVDWEPAELREAHAVALAQGVRARNLETSFEYDRSAGQLLREYFVDADVGGVQKLQAQIDWDNFLPGHSLGEWMHIASEVAVAGASTSTLPMFVDLAIAAGRSEVFELSAPIPEFGPGCMEPVNSFILRDRLQCLAQYLAAGLDANARLEAPLSALEAAEFHGKPAAAALMRSFLAKGIADAAVVDGRELRHVAQLV